MEAFFHRLTALAAWASQNPLTALFYAGLAVSILGTVGNALSYFPRVQAFIFNIAKFIGALVKVAGDVLAIIANARGKGIAGPLTLPGVPTLAKPALEEAQPKKDQGGCVGLAVLFALAGAFVVGAFVWHGLVEIAVLAFVIYAGLLLACSYRGRGPALLLVVLFGASTASCSFSKNLAADVKQCAGQTVQQAQWSDLQATADAALQLDWPNALFQLEQLAFKYGREFVNCVVADLRQQYGILLGGGIADAGVAVDPAAKALANAQRYIGGG